MTSIAAKKERNKLSQRKRRALGGRERDNKAQFLKRKDKRVREKEYWRNKERKKTPEGWAKAVLPGIRLRAKKKNLEFDLTWEDIVPPSHCPVLGIQINLLRGRPEASMIRSQTHWNTPSVDRIDNTKGYTKDNIKVVSLRANVLKTDGTLEEFKALVKYLGDAP